MTDTMNAALAVNVPTLLDLVRTNSFLHALAEGYYSVFREHPSESEVRSWRTSIPALVAVLNTPQLHDAAVLLEYRFPMYQDRADAVIVCGDQSEIRCVIVELKVCDEAQRLSRKHIRDLARAGRVTVFLFDERQRILPEEEGSEDAFHELVTENPITLNLRAPRRYAQGPAYVPWVVRLLTNPLDGPTITTDVARRPLFVANTLADLKLHLADHVRNGRDAAFVASFTESNGKNGGRLRADPPRIEWTMPGEYAEFWTKRRSNDLTHCASVYGCQGLESGAIGVIWGRDLVWRGKKWTIHEDHTITDYRGTPRMKDLPRRDPSLAITLLKNRYYILLTRSSLSTGVYCEDDETREFLRHYVDLHTLAHQADTLRPTEHRAHGP